MKYIVEIDLSNSAFNEHPGEEIARILNECANKVRYYSFQHDKTFYPLRDINGNTCGKHGYQNDY